jgi:hypothetical protein
MTNLKDTLCLNQSRVWELHRGSQSKIEVTEEFSSASVPTNRLVCEKKRGLLRRCAPRNDNDDCFKRRLLRRCAPRNDNDDCFKRRLLRRCAPRNKKSRNKILSFVRLRVNFVRLCG